MAPVHLARLTVLAAGLALLGGAPGAAASAPVPSATHRTTATIDVGYEPVGLAVSPSGRRLYVANSSRASVVSTSRRKVVASIPTGWGTSGVAVSPDGARLYAASSGEDVGNGRVNVIDTATNDVIATPIASGTPTDVVLNPAGTTLYVRDYHTGRILVLDLAGSAVVAVIPYSSGPFAVSPDGTRLYAFQDADPSNYGPWDLTVFDTATHARVASTSAVRSGALALDPSGARLYVAVPSGLAVVDAATLAVIGSVGRPCVDCGFGDLAANPRGPRLYATVVNSSDAVRDLLVAIDTESLRVVARTKVGEGVADVVVNPAGTRAYVANSDDGTVSVVNVTLHPPSAPRTVRVFHASGGVKVTWKRPSHRGAGRIDAYRVTAVPGGQTCTTTRRTCTVTGLVAGTEYLFEVRAHNRDGWGRARTSRPIVVAGAQGTA